jgi:ankyrin repeat protein
LEKVVAMLMRAGINISLQEGALFFAAGEGSLSVVVAVVEHGVPHLVHSFGHSAMLEAVRKGNAEVVKYFLERGLNIDKPGLDALLLTSVGYGSRGVASLLLENGADPNQQGLDGYNALSLAVIRDDAAMVLGLLDSRKVQDMDAQDLFFKCPVIQDKTTLNHASCATVRSHFRSWVRDVSDARDGAGAEATSKDGAPQHTYCLVVDDRSPAQYKAAASDPLKCG